MALFTALQQGTEEWLDARHGLLTGSSTAAMMIRDASKNEASFGVGAHDEAIAIASERWIGREPGYVSFDMQRGLDLEPDALDAYEDLTFRTVRRRAFLVHPDMPIGYSTDGLATDKEGDGVVEVKCLNATNHSRLWLGGDAMMSVVKKYHPQMQWYLWGTGRVWVDFVGYHPGAPKDKRLFVCRFGRDESYIAKLMLRAVAFTRIIDAYAEKMGVVGWKPFHVANPHLAFPTGWNATNGTLLHVA